MRTLVAVVGYRNLSDFSIGPVLLPELQAVNWGPGVDLEDLSYGPVAVMYNLQDKPIYDKMVFVSAVLRGRVAGGCYRVEFNIPEPPAAEIQLRVEEAITGVIDMDNLLILLRYFKVLAPEVIVFEVEPLDIEMGETLSPAVSAIAPSILQSVIEEANGRVPSFLVH